MGHSLGTRTPALLGALLLMALGTAIFLRVLLAGVMQSRAAAFALDAPATLHFALEETGAYTIFAEYLRTQDSLDMARPAGIEWIEIAVRHAEDNTELALSPVAQDRSYAIRRQVREPLYSFRIDAPGAFRIEAAYPPEEAGPPVRLVLSRSYEGQVTRAFGQGLAILFLTATLVILLLRWGRRSEPTDSGAAHSV